MPVRRPLLALVAALAVVASGLTAGGAASAAPTVTPAPNGYTPAPVTWAACPKADGFPKYFQCGTVAVPLDWNDPGGTRITLAVSRVRHTARHYQGVVITNPGGPGGPGRSLADLGSAVPGGVGKDYDWIGFDPRGVGASKPALSCDPDYFDGPRPAYEPSTKAIEHAWIRRSKHYAAACGTKNGALLAHITTRDTVDDIDALRVALGKEQINYFGYSYGATLGQVYGTLFPSHLRRVVLDSNTDPRQIWYPANNDQDVAAEKVSRVWFTWIAKHDRVYHLGTTQSAVSKAYYAAQRRLDRHPTGTIGGDEWADTMNNAFYSQSYWPFLAQGFSDLVVGHDPKLLRALYAALGAQPDDNFYAVYTATECNEATWPASYSVYEADQRRLNRVAPFNTWTNAWFNAPCVSWPLQPVAPVEVDGSHVASALLIDETLDAPAPYAGSIEVRRRFPTSVLVAEKGGTNHAASLSEGNSCVDTTIAAYLKDGTLPSRKAGGGADKFCAPVPQPQPVAGLSASSRSMGSMQRGLLGGGLRH